MIVEKIAINILINEINFKNLFHCHRYLSKKYHNKSHPIARVERSAFIKTIFQ